MFILKTEMLVQEYLWYINLEPEDLSFLFVLFFNRGKVPDLMLESALKSGFYSSRNS